MEIPVAVSQFEPQRLEMDDIHVDVDVDNFPQQKKKRNFLISLLEPCD